MLMTQFSFHPSVLPPLLLWSARQYNYRNVINTFWRWSGGLDSKWQSIVTGGSVLKKSKLKKLLIIIGSEIDHRQRHLDIIIFLHAASLHSVKFSLRGNVRFPAGTHSVQSKSLINELDLIRDTNVLAHISINE